ncbi:MAG: DUF4332 domain-containing protein [Anaerolineales bacterium]
MIVKHEGLEGQAVKEADFRTFLKRGGRSPSAIKRVIAHLKEYQGYLEAHGAALDDAGDEELRSYVDWVERASKTSAKTHLWALRYYYQFVENDDLEHLSNALRQERIQRKPFALKDFRGVQSEHVEKLAAVGIRNIKQMLKAGKTPADRKTLAEKSGVPLESILELVRLSDLARIPGVKGVRARLYVDAGVDSVEKMASWDPHELRTMVVEFVERTGFEGIATLPAEARYTVDHARKLPIMVSYEDD